MEVNFVTNLLEEGLIDQDIYQKILDIHRDTGAGFHTILLNNFILSESVLLEKLEDYYETPGIMLDELEIDIEAIEAVPEKAARDLQIIPLFVLGNTIGIGVEDPFNVDTLDYVKVLTGLKVQPFLCLGSGILHKLDEVYAVKDSIQKAIQTISDDKRNMEAAGEYLDDIQVRVEESSAPVVQLVNHILHQGFVMGASDIHLEPLGNRIALRYRIDGILHEFPGPPKILYSSIISRIKILSDMDLAERRHPQDGRINKIVYGQQIDFRVSIIPFIYGEGIVIRILVKKSRFNLSEIGFEEDDYLKIMKTITRPFGLILVTGPTGSGKSTSLFAILSHLNSPEKKIITLEDPVEHRLDGIMQLQAREDIGLTYTLGLKSVLRHDPDIVMLGEIRDKQSADITIRLALTGHLVLSTLHTNDASTSIDRLIEMGVPPYLVSETLIAALAQRLLRQLCDKCKKSDETMTGDKLKELISKSYNSSEAFSIYKPAGCEDCNNFGYKGRMAIYEIMMNDWDLKTAIPIKDFSSSSVRTYLRSTKVRSLRESGFLKALQGLTSIEEVYANTVEDVTM
ncbi:MAG: GspE/PulE family protein [Candidatus Eremiobacteraeota bacterium]|nr:GspE/PulE family protein [Candidatus Eremiobacteraeota bacterium]